MVIYTGWPITILKRFCGALSVETVARAADFFKIDYQITESALALVVVTLLSLRSINLHGFG
jgi:hypothetical protein